MAFNLGVSLKSNLKSSVVSTVSQRINSVVPGVNSQLINSVLSGVNIKNAALGSLTSGIKNELLGGIQGKLGGLISNAEELTGLIDTPLKIIERGVADLSGIAGGEYGLILDQFREQLNESAIGPEYLNNTFTPSSVGSTNSASKIPNPLRNHNGFNYTITLGVLDPEEYNNPEIYRSTGFKNYVISSSGGNLDKRYQVFDETGGGSSDHAEYYIDDIDLSSIVSPNTNTRMTLGTNLNFTVHEPYSMGNFVQAIIGSANDAGYASYTQAPFCLRIDFNGWNLGGTVDANFLQQPIFVPIQLINMEFAVSGQGSKYDVKAVPMSETGLSDNINKTKTSVRASGTFCHEVLETNDMSVTGVLNREIEDMEEAGALAPYDRYIICFPKNRQLLKKALQAGNISETAFTTSPEEQETQRRGYTGPDDGLRGSFSPKIITVSQPNQIYSVLKTFAEDTSSMNAIGKSPINEDTNSPGSSTEATVQAATDPESGLVDPGNQATQPSDKARDYHFSQGEKLTDIIEKVILQTTYAAEKSTEESTNGLNKWFRIDTHVYIDDSPLTESTMGRRPKIYVYSILEYEIDEAVTASNNQRSKNSAGIRELAVKEYNYIYTGKNEDVLSFDINFNNAFMMAAYADLGMNTGGLDPSNAKTNSSGNAKDKGAIHALPSDLKTTNEATGGVERITEVDLSIATPSNDIRRKIAEVFHDKITKTNVDMVTAEMTILGDPYFIPQQTGNYVAATSSNPSITQDGTMNMLDQSVFCIINFRTPFDYQVKGATMEFPQIVTQFSGIFQVWAVDNNFSSGKFTQTLKLIRRKGQDDDATTGASGVTQVDNSAALNKDSNQSDGTVGRSGNTSDDCEPAPLHDDIRNLLPAIPAIDALEAFGGIGKNITGAAAEAGVSLDAFGGIGKGIEISNAKDALEAFGGIGPNLTKDITKSLNNFTSGISNAAQVGIGSVSSARIRGAMGSISPVDATNALDVIAAEAAIVKQANAAVSGVKKQATAVVNNSIDSATNAAKSRISKLLGPF